MNDSKGHIEVSNDGSWTIFMRGKVGVNPFDALAELINANSETYTAMLEAAATFSSQAISKVNASTCA
jgi:hypothetical protein